MISRLFDRILDFPPVLSLALVFVLPALEASVFVGLVFPGETAVFLGGVLASQHRLSLWLVILVGCLGAVIGDSIGYEVGRRYGDRMLAKLPKWLIKPEKIEKAQDLLRRKGGRAVFVGRFTAALRALVPGLAGASRLPYGRFLVFNILGGVLWVVAVALVGYFAGSGFRAAEHRLSLISFGVLAVVVAAIAYYFLRQSDRVRRWTHVHLGFLLRLDRPLAFSLSILVASGWLFGGLLQDVVANEGVTLTDLQLQSNFIARRGQWLNYVARGVTELGSSPLVYGVLIAVGFLVWRRQGDWRRPLLALGALGVGQLVRFGIMEAVHRMRPPHELWLTPADGFSFPSGHTMTATIGYGLIAWLLTLLLPGKRVALVVATTALTVPVGLSRVYLGVHWPSDVTASWCLGVSWLALVSLAALTWRFRQRRIEGVP